MIDRSGLILDIFAQRAQTYEAQLQVECAQLNYVLPRLTRMWTHLSRLGGGIGTRGPGEKQLEVDKRQISARLTHIKKKLNKVQQDRKNRRSPRSLLPLITGAIVGYTNAGKSTLMRRLTDADVFVEDKLFATLDPTTKKVQLPDKTQLVLTDTVGFIQKLPTHLINAFFSTLEEASESDFLIHVVDASHPNLCNIIETSNNIITQLGAHEKPMIYIFNKWDKVAKPNTIKSKIKDFHPQLCISIKNSQDLSTIYDIIIDVLAKFKKKMSFFIPYHRMDIVHLLHQYGDVLHVNYTEHIEMDVDLNEILGKKIMSQLYKEEK